MTLRLVTRNLPLAVLMLGSVLVISAGRPSQPVPQRIEFGPVERLQARFYAAVVMDYRTMAPWAATAGYEQPGLVLARGAAQTLGTRFADVALSESIARHDWSERQRQAAVAAERVALNTPQPQPRQRRQPDLGQDRAQDRGQAQSRRMAASADAPGAMPPAPESPVGTIPGIPADVPFVSPVEAIGGAANSLTDVDAALRQAIAAAGG